MSTQPKQYVLWIKDKQMIISHLEKGEKGTNISSTQVENQQAADLRHTQKQSGLSIIWTIYSSPKESG